MLLPFSKDFMFGNCSDMSLLGARSSEQTDACAVHPVAVELHTD